MSMTHRYSFVCGCGAVVVAQDSAAIVLETTICGRHIEAAHETLMKHGDGDFQIDWIEEMSKGAALIGERHPTEEPPPNAA